jgi:hypothetical protein
MKVKLRLVLRSIDIAFVDLSDAKLTVTAIPVERLKFQPQREMKLIGYWRHPCHRSSSSFASRLDAFSAVPFRGSPGLNLHAAVLHVLHDDAVIATGHYLCAGRAGACDEIPKF